MQQEQTYFVATIRLMPGPGMMKFALWNRAAVMQLKPDQLIEFLRALIQDAGKKVFLILYNLRVHHSKPVKAWVGEHRDKIELFYLPSYSPVLNPEERLNADLKNALYSKVPVRSKAKLKAVTTEHMQSLEKSPERVKKFFQDARVKYAA